MKSWPTSPGFSTGSQLGRAQLGRRGRPDVWTYAALDGVASRVIRSDNLSPDVLESTVPVLNALKRSEYCLPKAMHDAAIIRGRMLQIAMDASDPDQVRQEAAAAGAMIRRSLSCVPADPFLWLALSWLDGMQHGFSDELISYLSKSYELGPYEGWIALRRNKYALIIYPLPAPSEGIRSTSQVGLYP